MFSKELQAFIKKNKDKKIVFTNGCFDILHRGHLAYLNDAKNQGDILIVGLNSDSSVKGLKGEVRPIHNQNDRKYFLENLSSVDFVEVFSDETPYELIKYVSPNILVKGGDWAVEKIVGHDVVLANGGEVKSLRFENGYSTTEFIASIQGKK